MSTKRQIRITKQVRLQQALLMKLKHIAIEQRITCSALLDSIVITHLEKHSKCYLEQSEKSKYSESSDFDDISEYPLFTNSYDFSDEISKYEHLEKSESKGGTGLSTKEIKQRLLAFRKLIK